MKHCTFTKAKQYADQIDILEDAIDRVIHGSIRIGCNGEAISIPIPRADNSKIRKSVLLLLRKELSKYNNKFKELQ